MSHKKISIIFSCIATFLVLFLFASHKATITCADYGQGSCSAQNSICYTGPDGVDLAGGYQCGNAQGYKYANGGNNSLVSCHDGLAGGRCCDQGVPNSPLPDHTGYDLGGKCGNLSICYTGDYSDPKPGQQCGGLTGWHYGTTGGGQPTVPSCAGFGIGNAVCCDVGAATVGSGFTGPCPSDSKNGDCKSIVTGIGKIDVSSPSDFIATAFGVLLSFAGGIALIIIIISGYRILVSRGDPERLKNAREALTAAVVGLLFIIFSIVILQIIAVDIFHIPGFSK